MKKAIITLYYKVTCAIYALPPVWWFLYHKEMHRGCQGFSYLVSDPGVLGALYRALEPVAL